MQKKKVILSIFLSICSLCLTSCKKKAPEPEYVADPITEVTTVTDVTDDIMETFDNVILEEKESIKESLKNVCITCSMLPDNCCYFTYSNGETIQSVYLSENDLESGLQTLKYIVLTDAERLDQDEVLYMNFRYNKKNSFNEMIDGVKSIQDELLSEHKMTIFTTDTAYEPALAYLFNDEELSQHYTTNSRQKTLDCMAYNDKYITFIFYNGTIQTAVYFKENNLNEGLAVIDKDLQNEIDQVQKNGQVFMRYTYNSNDEYDESLEGIEKLLKDINRRNTNVDYEINEIKDISPETSNADQGDEY